MNKVKTIFFDFDGVIVDSQLYAKAKGFALICQYGMYCFMDNTRISSMNKYPLYTISETLHKQ